MNVHRATQSSAVSSLAFIGLVMAAAASDGDDTLPPPPPLLPPSYKPADPSRVSTKGHLNLDQHNMRLPEPAKGPVPSHISLSAPARATAEIKKLHQDVGQLLLNLDFEPPQRKPHFAWMDQHMAVLKGWRGSIVASEATPFGIKVRIRVFPNVSLPGGPAGFSDYVTEEYLCTDGKAVFVGFIDPGPQTQAFFKVGF